MTTATDLVGLLYRDLVRRPDMPNGVFATEVQAPHEGRRADVVWLGLTSNSGQELVGFEVKVTRDDLRAELADPTKADAWARYCDRFWLVVPHLALTRGLELPAQWGVLTPPSGRCTRKMTVERQALPLHPADPVPGVRAVAAWVFWRNKDLRRELATAGLRPGSEREWSA